MPPRISLRSIRATRTARRRDLQGHARGL
jgi:hypothetical protein